jgi:two-component system sensor histidine kinase KdpD
MRFPSIRPWRRGRTGLSRPHSPNAPLHRANWRSWASLGLAYGVAGAGVAVVTALIAFAGAFFWLPNAEIAYLAVVMPVAVLFGRGPAVAAALMAALAYNWNFIPPAGRFTLFLPREWLAEGLFLAVAITTGQLAAGLRARAEEARRRERETSLLYQLVSAIAHESDLDAILAVIAAHAREAFGARRSAVWLRDRTGELRLAAGSTVDPAGETVALPLRNERRDVGELRLGFDPPRLDQTASEQRFQQAFLNQATLAVERALLTREAREAQLLREADQLKSALLSSVSHALRTPLATILGSTTSLLQRELRWTEEARREVLDTIADEALHLNQLIGNLLDMSRIEVGALHLNREPQVLSELVEDTLAKRLRMRSSHRLIVEIPEEFPLLDADYGLIQHVLVNLLGNAAKYSPEGTEIRVEGVAAGEWAVVRVVDQGPGIPPEERERVFQRFYRLERRNGRQEGMGLGLPICRSILEAHGGRLWIEDAPRGGAIFAFALPALPLDSIRMGVEDVAGTHSDRG